MTRVLLIIAGCLLLCANLIQGCHYYRDGEEMEEEEEDGGRRRRSVAYTSDTTFLRDYFTDCMAAMIADPSYDWRSNIDFTVLDSLWHLNTLQIYCSPSVNEPNHECWQREVANYLKTSSDKVLQTAQLCIAHYAEDVGQEPRANRYRIMAARNRNKRSAFPESQNKTNPDMNGFDRLPSYDECLRSSIAFRSVRDPLQFNKLSYFINENTINLCDSRSMPQSRERPSWPYRFVALTRPDTDIRRPLESCAIQVFPPDPFWSVWGGWGSCSKTCGKGILRRTRTCRSGRDPREEVQGCPGASSATRGCQLKTCPRDYYYWGRWSRFSSCSRRCGGGQQYKTRRCLKNGKISVRITHCLRYGRARYFRYCNRYPCYRYK